MKVSQESLGWIKRRGKKEEKEGNPRSFLAAPWSDHTLSRVGVWT